MQVITLNICALKKLKMTVFKPYPTKHSLQKNPKKSSNFKHELCKLSTQNTKDDKNVTGFLKRITKK